MVYCRVTQVQQPDSLGGGKLPRPKIWSPHLPSVLGLTIAANVISPQNKSVASLPPQAEATYALMPQHEPSWALNRTATYFAKNPPLIPIG